MRNYFDTFWHGTLQRPYRLAKTYDTGQGQGVVLLHGIGRTGKVWNYVESLLEKSMHPYRVVSFDLLGFGQSPKPTRISYTADDHARAVIASIEKLHVAPVIIVGHSMGSLVAVRVAKLRPDLVRHLVLYEMPLYEGMPKGWHYRTRINLYYRLYDWITKQHLSYSEIDDRLRERLTKKVVGAEVTAETWLPFKRSLRHTIMNQSAAQDLPTLKMPVDVIYGSRDMLVIRGKVVETLGLNSDLVTTHTIRERHIISKQASSFIVGRIENAGSVKP